MQSIRDSNWRVLIVTPPCHTHSRSRNNWRASPGPRPLRSKDFPYGFPWLTPKNKRVCEQANLFIAQTIEAALASVEVDAPFVIEHLKIWELHITMKLLRQSGNCQKFKIRKRRQRPPLGHCFSATSLQCHQNRPGFCPTSAAQN